MKYLNISYSLMSKLCTNDMVVGTCSPRFFRATTYGIPYSGDLLRQTHVPAAVVITPFARLNPREVGRKVEGRYEICFGAEVLLICLILDSSTYC